MLKAHILSRGLILVDLPGEYSYLLFSRLLFLTTRAQDSAI